MKPFIPAVKLFPQWVTAPVILKMIVDEINGFVTKVNPQDPCEIIIAPDAPDGVFYAVPSEDRDKFWDIMKGIGFIYVPSPMELMGIFGSRSRSVDAHTISCIDAHIKARECEQISKGGMSLKGALHYHFGLSPFHNDWE